MAQLLRVQDFGVSADGYGAGEPQSLEVVLRELAVAGFGAQRPDEPLLLEVAELARAELGELRRQTCEHLTDAQVPRGRRASAG